MVDKWGGIDLTALLSLGLTRNHAYRNVEAIFDRLHCRRKTDRIGLISML